MSIVKAITNAIKKEDAEKHFTDQIGKGEEE